MRRAASLLLFASVALAPAVSARQATRLPSIGDYFTELERLGLLDRSTGTREALEAELARAEASLEEGDPAGAAVRLYSIVESPRFSDFSDLPAYQNAEYDLLVALAASGSYEAALGYAERILGRGPGSIYFAAAHRRAVDIALETRDFAGVLARLQAIRLTEPLPVEATFERRYLAARAAYDTGRLDAAEGELVQIGKKSRLYTSALYLRGVIRARRGAFSDAADALCEVAQSPDSDRYTFVIDDRYFTLKDLARLGLGRLAHEERRYDDAYYHYFQIPDDSERLAEALFEAAWSMYQKRELATARDLVAEFLSTFPNSPLAPEAMLLAGYVELADCKFEEARRTFERTVRDLQPLVDEVAAIRRSPERRRGLMTRAVEDELQRRKAPEAAATSRRRARAPWQRILAMLRLDPRLLRFHEAVVGLRRATPMASASLAAWRQLAARVGRTGGPAVTPVAAEMSPEEEEARAAAQLLGDVARLRADIARERADLRAALARRQVSRGAAGERLSRLDEIDAQLRALEADVRTRSQVADARLSAAADPRLRAMIVADLANARDLEDRARRLTAELEAAATRLSDEALARLHDDLRRVLDKAKLGRVDAVIGQKRRLEIEVEDLAQGRYPPELHGRLYEEGLIGDDEEYWPPEEEVWEDEYEGWR